MAAMDLKVGFEAHEHEGRFHLPSTCVNGAMVPEARTRSNQKEKVDVGLIMPLNDALGHDQ